MTIKQHGGVFGRNPVFNDLSAETLSIAGTALSSTADELNILDGVTADATELNYLDGASTSVVTASKAVLANATGNIAFASGKGVDFSATAGTGTSELLNDYEEGNWDPVYISATGTITSHPNSSGKYVKVGRNVFVWGNVSYSSDSSASGNITVGGLPFTSIASGFGQSSGRAGGVFAVSSALFTSNAPTQGLILSNSTTIIPYIATATGATQLAFSDFSTSANHSQFLFSGQYLAA